MQRALVFMKDMVREHYQVLLFSLLVQGCNIESIVWKLNGDQLPLALFAITPERV